MVLAMRFKSWFTFGLKLFGGDLDVDPLKLTLVQSILVTVFATALAVVCYELVGRHHPGLTYQIGVTLFVASVLAPIFLYPTFRTTGLLRRANSQIAKYATTDHLTDLPNMQALSEQIDLQFKNDSNDNRFAVHFIDLNRFKQVNDSLGHDAGDAVLVEAATRLRNAVGEEGFISRYGGDEFVVLQFQVESSAQATSFALNLRSKLAQHYHIKDREIDVGATIGTALSSTHGENQLKILKSADLALYYAKERGIPHRMFDPVLAEEAEARQRREEIIKDAIETGSMSVHYQSIVRLENPLHIAGFEALVRFEGPDTLQDSVSDLIEVAESSGLIVEMGAAILKEACTECARWHSDLYVAVNVSPVQFLRSDFVRTIQDVLKETGLEPNRLELEITESVLINDIAYVTLALQHLRDMGVRIALDDFGSGFCGLHYLRQFTIDKIKVDKSIIDDAGQVNVATNILRGISSIANELGLTVAAEGVDTIAKAEFLAKEKCADELQGYLFSRPVSALRAFRMQEFIVQEREEQIGKAYPDAPDGQGAEVVSLANFVRQNHGA